MPWGIQRKTPGLSPDLYGGWARIPCLQPDSQGIPGNGKPSVRPCQQSTIIMTGQDGTIYNIRVTGNPEKNHDEIYKIFVIVNLIKRRKTTVNERR
ncbi:hypothetical protein [Acetobacterium sp.]|uniref:hypothetical protein n=1 Tax=Acetobacterium sp. TaxID=1872094 RepID=UPI002F427310